MVFERATERVCKIMMIAQEESVKLGHRSIGGEQILLGLILENPNSVIDCLKHVTADDVRGEIEKTVGRGTDDTSKELSLTPRAQRIFEFAYDAARAFGKKIVSPDHLWLGLLHEQEGVAIRVLENLNVNPNKLREEFLQRAKSDS